MTNNLKTLVLLSSLILVLLVFASITNAHTKKGVLEHYTCNEGIPLEVEFLNSGNVSVAIISVDTSPKYVLANVITGSGAKYSDGKWTLHTKGDTAVLSWGEGDDVCKKDSTVNTSDADIQFPFPAKSWGGVVRSGAGMQYEKLASLKEREPVTLLEKTQDLMNGYYWFKIEYRGKIGYQWGGILCPISQPVNGTYEVCH